ncbi:MAG: 3-methyl-2-oxobutanoate hydroxymethyltransferase [Aeromicrobium erythreum]
MNDVTPAQGPAAEEPAPYGSARDADAPTAPPPSAPAADPTTDPAIRRVRTHHLARWKAEGHRWAMLTTYDQYTAATFDEAGIPVFLVGDSAANNVYGYDSSLPVTVDELLPLVKAVTRASSRALVVADLPFGSYQRSPEQAYDTAVRFMKEGEAHAVKLEGGAEMAPQVELLTKGGVPVVAHIGFTPQSEHSLGGYRVQGRGDAAQRLLDDALALQEAGAFAVVMEMVPAPVAAEVTRSLRIPTIGIGAGVGCDAQVLVWQDMMGLRTGRAPRFVKRYADLHTVMLDAARAYAADVSAGTFPGPEHSFDS